jgi:hypothetical protein
MIPIAMVLLWQNTKDLLKVDATLIIMTPKTKNIRRYKKIAKQ